MCCFCKGKKNSSGDSKRTSPLLPLPLWRTITRNCPAAWNRSWRNLFLTCSCAKAQSLYNPLGIKSHQDFSATSKNPKSTRAPWISGQCSQALGGIVEVSVQGSGGSLSAQDILWFLWVSRVRTSLLKQCKVWHFPPALPRNSCCGWISPKCALLTKQHRCSLALFTAACPRLGTLGTGAEAAAGTDGTYQTQWRKAGLRWCRSHAKTTQECDQSWTRVCPLLWRWSGCFPWALSHHFRAVMRCWTNVHPQGHLHASVQSLAKQSCTKPSSTLSHHGLGITCRLLTHQLLC